MSGSGFRFYPPSRPRRVENGIKARGTRGSIGQSWWSRRFIDVIESFALGTRLTRGRAYARAGQVVELSVAPGVVSAVVQGSRVTPYRVTIGLAPFTDPVWGRVEAALAAQALYSARLLAGEVPAELEEIFAAEGAPLFPASVRDLDMRCSCPDPVVPCKHLAATFYLLAEVLDDDPFQLAHWRGRPRDVLLDRLRQLRSVVPGAAEPSLVPAASEAASGTAHGAGRPVAGARLALADLTSRPLAECSGAYWRAEQPLPDRPAALSTDPDLLLRQLATPGTGLGGEVLVDLLRPAYRRFGVLDPTADPTADLADDNDL